eukprot:3656801-Amphidinium_carterae.1
MAVHQNFTSGYSPQSSEVIVHGYAGTPAFSMDEPPAASIHSVYRDPQREYIDTDEHTRR